MGRRLLILALASLLLPLVAHAQERQRLNLEAVKAASQAELDGQVLLFFLGEPHPQVLIRLTQVSASGYARAQRDTEAACTRAVLSALSSLQNRTLAEGGNALLNIHSLVEDTPTGADTIECSVGLLRVGATLTGNAVRVEQQR